MKKKSKAGNKPNKSALRSRLIKISVIILILLIAGAPFGITQYAFASVKCLRQPVLASRFMASYTYILPGDKMYNPNMFSEYYCSEQDAKDAGFRPSPLTDAGDKAADENRQKIQELKTFSKSQIAYVAFKPTYAQFEYSTPEFGISRARNEPTTFIDILKNEKVVAKIRENKIDTEYELCRLEKYPCEDAGYDNSGQVIRKQLPIKNRPTVSYSLRKEGTFVNIEGADINLPFSEIQNIYNSLTRI